MSERLRSMDDGDLGAALSSLDIEWPPTPALRAAVMARATSDRHPALARLPLSRAKRTMLIAAATVLLLAGAAIAARIVIDLGAVVVEVTPGHPGNLSTPSIAPTGEPVTLEEAALLLGRDVPIPERLGPPDRVWADEVFAEATVARVTLAWRARPGLPEISATRYGAVLMVFEGDADIASKDVYEDTGVLQFETIDGVDYFWTRGAHLLELLTGDGVVYVPVEGNVLLWRDGPHTMRLETSLPKAEVIRIAASTGTP